MLAFLIMDLLSTTGASEDPRKALVCMPTREQHCYKTPELEYSG